MTATRETRSAALVPARMHRPRRRRRGEGLVVHYCLRWTYARWIQVIAHADLQGPDGRPSQSKLASAIAMGYGVVRGSDVVVVIALCAAFGPKMLVRAIQAWRGISAGISQVIRRDTRTETIDRKIVADADGDYEVTR